jgi:hypothetical protein
MYPRMAGGVQEHTVLRAVAASMGTPDDVMVVPSRQARDLLVTDRAEAALFLPQMQELPSPHEGMGHLDAEALLEVDLPRRVIGISLFADVSPRGYGPS